MKTLKLVIALCLVAGVTKSQNCFMAGDGSDGAYSAVTNTTLAGGSYSFTTFNINAGVVVTVTGNVPLKIYCTGAATIDGTLTVAGGDGSNGVTYNNGGPGGVGVAGGGNGGDGSYSSNSGPIVGMAGSGQGGVGNQGDGWSGGGGAGYALVGGSSGNGSGGFGGPAYGTAVLTNLDAGSGGGGGSGGYSCGAGGGGAGGGIVLIFSSISVNISGSGAINANGGNGGSDGTGNCGGGAGGSGGTIWLAAPAVTNNGLITAVGGVGGASSVSGSPYFGTGATGSAGRLKVDVNTQSGSGIIQPAVGSTTNVAVNLLFVVVTGTNTCANTASGSAVVTALSGNAPYSYNWLPANVPGVTITNLAAGVYTAVVTDADGCIASNTVAISANPNPTVTITSSTLTICDGQQATLIATGASAFAWSTQETGPTVIVSPSITTSYTVTGTDANNCTGTAMQSVVVNALPDVSLTVSSGAVCSSAASGGSTVILTGLPSNGVFSGTNVNGNLFPPTTPGTYAAAYSFTNSITGCAKTATANIIVSLCTGLADNLADATVVSAYPNPTTGFFTLRVNEPSQVMILNSLGQLLSDKTLEGGESAVDLSSQPKGLYFVSIKTNGNTYVAKVVKE